MFFKIGVLKNFANFAGKHLCWSLFLIKLQAYSKQKQSCLHMFFKIGVLKNCVNFTGKHLCRNLFLIKLLTNFVKRHSNSGVFLWNLEKLQEHLFYRTPPVAASVKRDSNTCEICEILKNIFLYRTPAVAASEWTLLSSKMRNNKNQHDFWLISCVF